MPFQDFWVSGEDKPQPQLCCHRRVPLLGQTNLDSYRDDEDPELLTVDRRVVALHVVWEGSAPIFILMIPTTTSLARITCVSIGDDCRIHDEGDPIEFPDVCVPPEDVQLHVLGECELVVLLLESLETRQQAAQEASGMLNTTSNPQQLPSEGL